MLICDQKLKPNGAGGNYENLVDHSNYLYFSRHRYYFGIYHLRGRNDHATMRSSDCFLLCCCAGVWLCHLFKPVPPLLLIPNILLFYSIVLRVSTASEMPYLDTRSEAHLWLRDFQTQIKPNETQRNTLIVAGVFVVCIGILWYVPYSSVHAKFKH